MSWLSEGVRWMRERAKIHQRVKEEAPDAIPLLDALAANDYQRAATVLLGYGDVEEVLARLPAGVRQEVERSAPIILELLDHAIPEEAIIRILELAGVERS